MRNLILGFAVVAAFTPASAADYAPINRRDAAEPALYEICHNYSLGQKEARMATLYGIATSLVPMGRRGELNDTQRDWLAERERCGADASCLFDVYDRGIRRLNGVIDDIASRGPY